MGGTESLTTVQVVPLAMSFCQALVKPYELATRSTFRCFSIQISSTENQDEMLFGRQSHY